MAKTMTIYIFDILSGVVLTVIVIRIGFVLNKRVCEARHDVARMVDGVAETIAALQAADDARLTRARVALDRLLHAGPSPYRQSAKFADDDGVTSLKRHVVNRAGREEALCYKHALEVISSLDCDPISAKIAKRALEEK